MRWLMGMVAMWCLPPGNAYGQTPDTLKPYTLPPTTVSVTRTVLPLAKTPHAVQSVSRSEISAARPMWGLDEALFTVPGVLVANRYNFSVDQRLSIRGFGARSAFAVRGVKVLLDGVPQTLPDGQGQLTNVELGEADRIDVLRGSSSALFGNASGGVISISTLPPAPHQLSQELRVTAGAFDRQNGRNWSKWVSGTRIPVGDGGARITVARLSYEGERDHTEADLRSLNARLWLPVPSGWTLAVMTDVGDQPVANNPGTLTLAELRANRDTAARLNLLRDAGKDVLQVQGGATLRRTSADGEETALTVFGLKRDLANPLPQAYITVGRHAYGVRASATRPLRVGNRRALITAGVDVQWQRDDRQNYSYAVPNGALTTPNNTRDTLILNQFETVTELGPFVQGVFDVTERVSLTAGLRYDRVSFGVADRHTSDGTDDSGRRLMDAISGTVGVTVNPSPALTAYANVGTSFETPTTTELANRPTGAGGFNPDLKPQTATNFEIGARGTASRASWSIAIYQANVRAELISFEVPDPLFPGRRYFRNAGSARHRGIEVGGGVAMARGLDLLGSWTYSDLEYTDYQLGSFDLRGRTLPGIPRHSLRLGLRAQPGFARGMWTDVDVTHTSRIGVDDTLAAAQPVAGWWVTNVRLGWQGRVGSTSVAPFIGLSNAFNVHYVGSVVINAAPIGGAPGRYYEPAPGRHLYIGFSIKADR
ncbi:MAG TPA: TonB-dependent receptor [Gemmatimonadales bacterium]|nr:TonB-dependent receptor [Gemmatimonadales bacterium]